MKILLICIRSLITHTSVLVRLYDFLEDHGAEEDGNENTQNGQDDDQKQEQGAKQARGI